MIYIHSDEDGRILAIHETGHVINAEGFTPVDSAPEDPSRYLFKSGKFERLSDQRRLDLYFNGVDPELELAKAVEKEKQEAELLESMKTAFLKQSKGLEPFNLIVDTYLNKAEINFIQKGEILNDQLESTIQKQNLLD